MRSFKTLAVGDVVQLRSGGVVMTVERILEDRAICVWNDKMLRTRREDFLLETIAHAKSGDMTPMIEGFNATAEDIVAHKRALGLGSA